jgi:urea transport system permease protein
MTEVKLSEAVAASVAPSKPDEALPLPPPTGVRPQRVAIIGLSLLLLFSPPYLFDGDSFWMGLFAKYMALAILALSVDLIWGYTGLLSLGQGVYFGLGAYMVAYSLTLQKAAKPLGLAPGMAPPQFMQYTGPAPNDPSYIVPTALTWIAPLGNIWVALAASILVPMLVATLFGWVTFRFRIRSVYFSLVTQALLLAVFTIVRNQQRYTGGVVGIKDLVDLELFGQKFNLYADIRALNFLIAGVLVATFLACSLLVRTKFGKILTAIRDNENRVLALGYNTAMYKTFAFAVAGALGGLAGGLYVAANELCGPSYLSIAFSIEAVIWVAVGGRGTLLGAVAGVLLVSFAQSYVSSAFPDFWPIVLGGLFVIVVLFLPRGLAAVVGDGTLLGALLGVIFVRFVDKAVLAELPKFWRVVFGCGFITGMVFLPWAVGQGVRLILARRQSAAASAQA